MTILAALSRALLAFVAAHQYSGLFAFLVIEEAGVPLPLPGDTLIVYAGVRARAGEATAATAIAIVAVAATLGSSARYWLARRGGRPALARYGRVLHLHPARVARMEDRFRHWGIWAILLGRLIPGLRTPTSVMAGLFERQWRDALTLITGDFDASVGSALVLGAAMLTIAALRRRRRRPATRVRIGREATGEVPEC